ncbi:hypothetical protein ACHQM5_003260 [Ranunculus cassubicifolius]
MKQPPPQTQQQQALNCPRCNSANTKFCYYNNYSLSQPRHFCKACKRYWTRGGTLRSVPVGGGCRKNKKLTKRPNSDYHLISTLSTTKSTGNMNPISNNAAYDINQSQFNAFKPVFPTLGASSFTGHGLTSFPRFGDSPSSILSGLKETIDDNPCQTLFPLQGLLMASCGSGSNKEAKFGGGNDPMNNNTVMGAHGIEQLINSSFDSSVYWNSIGAWPDPSNYGSSETSLI